MKGARGNRLRVKKILSLVLLPIGAAFASGEEYHVATTGSDGHPGGAEAPFATIQKCAEVARPGDICLVRDGSYPERISAVRAGAPGNLITFQAQGTVVTRGFTLDTGYIRVEGFEITDTPTAFPHHYGIYLRGEGYEILGNTIHRTVRDGVYCAKEEPAVSRSLIRGNAIRYADGTGITLYGEENVLN